LLPLLKAPALFVGLAELRTVVVTRRVLSLP
jgi:hypothetical protein